MTIAAGTPFDGLKTFDPEPALRFEVAVERTASGVEEGEMRRPLPTTENWLKVAIRAGEKSFHGS